MKWLISAVLCVLATSAAAQELPQGTFLLESSLVCGPYDPANNEQLLSEYGEIPFLEGDGEVISSDVNLSFGGKIRMFMNPQTTGWTLLLDIKSTVTCMIASGSSAGPAELEDDI